MYVHKHVNVHQKCVQAFIYPCISVYIHMCVYMHTEDAVREFPSQVAVNETWLICPGMLPTRFKHMLFPALLYENCIPGTVAP